MDRLSQAKDAAKATAQTAVDGLKDSGLGGLADKGKAAVDDAKDKVVDKAIGWTEDKVTEHAGKAVEKCGEKIKEGMRGDHQIPHFVATMLCDLVDDLLPDVREEVVYTIMGQVYARRPLPQIVHESRGCVSRLLGCFRGAILFHLMPYDNGGGGRITDVWWWLLMLPMVCPVLGIQQLWFLFLFLLIDKGDEFQLCAFILNFKGMQALTVGIIGAIRGAALYGICVNVLPPTCHVDAPGMSEFFFIELGAFFGQIVLVWVAFMLLPCSDKKGVDARVQRAVARAAGDAEAVAAIDQASQRGGNCCTLSKERGGKLRSWLIFDTVIFLLAAGCVILIVALKGAAVLSIDWKFRQTLYWAKVLYGLLSTPYMLFKLPLAPRLITHARPTGYDKAGRLRPCQGKPAGGEKEDKHP